MATKKAELTPRTTPLQYIRTIYLSLGAVIGLICFVMGASGAIKLALNIWFPVDNYAYYSPYSSPCTQPSYSADGKTAIQHTPAEIATCEKLSTESQVKQQTSEFNRQLSESVALTVVGFPVWMLHFWLIQMDWKKRKQL